MSKVSEYQKIMKIHRKYKHTLKAESKTGIKLSELKELRNLFVYEQLKTEKSFKKVVKNTEWSATLIHRERSLYIVRELFQGTSEQQLNNNLLIS